MLGVVVVYLGLIVASLGGLSVLRPLSFLAIRTRRQAALVLALGFMVSVMGGSLPARETRVATPRTQLDQFAPVYQFSEFHSIRIAAPKEQVYRALKLVTADEIALFRTLTWLRRFGRRRKSQFSMSPPEHHFLFWPRSRTAKLFWDRWRRRRLDGAPAASQLPTPSEHSL